MSDDNPLLAPSANATPRFTAIRPEHVVPAVEARIAEHEALLEERLARGGPYGWDDLIAPLDAAEERLELAFGPIGHLNSVLSEPALRAAYEEALPLLTEHAARVGQDARLFAAVGELREQAEALGLDAVQRRVLDLALRDFRLAGVALPPEGQQRYRELQVELSQLQTRFSNNLVDETKDFRLVLEDPADVRGLPQSLLELARAQALEDDPAAPEHRWTFTLHAPSVQPFLQYQPRRELRERLYRAFVSRAASGERDNTPLIERILALRAELARLLGFESYAEYSLAANKMAERVDEVTAFLEDLAERSLPYGRRELEELTAFAREQDGLERLESYDVAYYRERLRQARYAFSDEEVREYFPLERVLEGMFEVMRRLYGIALRDATGRAGFETWHPDVRLLEVDGPDGAARGFLYLDLFARDGKRQGAWMNDCVQRRPLADGTVQLPVAYLVCNFAAPVGGKPTLLRHGEVRTLFHELGHCLHHVLTRVDHRKVAGIGEVPWDGVELPSQFQENWVWQRESLALISGHHRTGEPLPEALLEKMLAAKNFMSGCDMLRQLELALFDFELHHAYTPGEPGGARALLERVRDRVAVIRPPAYDRFECGFGHIFAGGYAAGYYSYKWAELLAADAFSRFEEEGLFSPEAGRAFREQILERGGSAPFMDLYVQFRGRRPTPDALLRQSGLVGAER